MEFVSRRGFLKWSSAISGFLCLPMKSVFAKFGMIESKEKLYSSEEIMHEIIMNPICDGDRLELIPFTQYSKQLEKSQNAAGGKFRCIFGGVFKDETMRKLDKFMLRPSDMNKEYFFAVDICWIQSIKITRNDGSVEVANQIKPYQWQWISKNNILYERTD